MFTYAMDVKIQYVRIRMYFSEKHVGYVCSSIDLGIL